MPYQMTGTAMGFFMQIFLLDVVKMAQGNLALFFTYATNMGAYFQHIVLLLLLFVPALIVISIMKSNLAGFIIMSILAGTSLSAYFLLPWSMLPDVVDDFKVKNPSCQDLEPLFYSCYVFFNKFGGGYKPGACTHNPEVISSLWLLFIPVPVCLLLISLVTFCFYPISSDRKPKKH